MNKKGLFKFFRKLRKKLGDYYETGAGRCNEGFAFYLLRLCNEMPWMFNQPAALIKEFYEREKVSGGLDESILMERFKNLGKFQKVILKS